MNKIFLLTVVYLSIFSGISQVNNGLYFDGVQDFVNLDDLQSSFYNNSSNFTIEFWMKANKDDQTSSIRTCMFAINEPTGENRLLIILGGPVNQDGKLMIYDDGAWGSGAIYTSTQLIGDNECHHIAYSFDGTNGRVYIDGVLDDTHSTSYGITLNDRYSLGQEYDNMDSSQFYNGMIDDLRIWNVVRTDSEIMNGMNYELSGTESNLIAYYDFNQGVDSGNNAGIDYLTDLSSANIDGSLHNFSLNGSISNWVRSVCTFPFVSIEEQQETEDLLIFPNPTNDLLYISIEDESKLIYISITDVQSREVFHESKENLVKTEKGVEIQVSLLENGIYFVNVESETKSFVKKIIIR